MYLIFGLYLGALYRRTYGINLTYGIEFMNPIENSTISAWFVLKNMVNGGFISRNDKNSLGNKDE